MTDLSENISLDEPVDLSSSDVINDQSELTYNGSINGTLDSLDSRLGFSDGTMRFLFLAVATITVLICLTICISVCICVCLNRRRKLKRQEKQDHLLLPEQSERISTKRLPTTNSIISSNGKQQSDKKILSSSIQQSLSNMTPISPYYYDNLDDIPFIDESRPTSYIDMTRV